MYVRDGRDFRSLIFAAVLVRLKRSLSCWDAEQKKAAMANIGKMNKELEPNLRAKWELSTSISRRRLDTMSKGKKPTLHRHQF
jgi:hypothetical protein